MAGLGAIALIHVIEAKDDHGSTSDQNPSGDHDTVLAVATARQSHFIFILDFIKFKSMQYL